MDNKHLAKPFRQLAQLMEVYDENTFKIKAFASAALKIDKYPIQLSTLSLTELENQIGIGKSTASKVWELLQTGNIAELEQYKSKTPAGILEMLHLKGLGPKKLRTIWLDLHIESISELYYACNENRLAEAKGFGIKTQEELKKAIEFTFKSKGKYLYSLAEPLADVWIERLQKLSCVGLVMLTGDLRRRSEIVESIDLVLTCNSFPELISYFKDLAGESSKEGSEPLKIQQLESNYHNIITQVLVIQEPESLPLTLYIASEVNAQFLLFITTGSKAHLEQFKLNIATNSKTEEEIYASFGLPFIEPELREEITDLEQIKESCKKKLLDFADLQGTIHNHSTYSDGVHTLEEMAQGCIEMGLKYLAICDHSQSAFYANGLSSSRVITQQNEIDQLNLKISPFKIYKGIESDILADGSLDYANTVLASFQLVVASIHSGFRMNEKNATERLIKAISNPYTSILGHPTGRLLLGREGYPIDHKQIIDACATYDVVIEINSNPNRLDIDWRWVPYALSKGVLLSINPDAHRKEGLQDMRYGVLMARKGGLTKESCLNAFDLNQFEEWIKRQHKKRK